MSDLLGSISDVTGEDVRGVVLPDAPPLPDLGGLGERIEAEYGAVSRSGRETLLHAMAAGDLIHEARGRVPDRQWTAWLDANTSVSVPTAYMYERLAANRQQIESAGDFVQSITEAVKVLGLKRLETSGGRPVIERATGRSEKKGSGRPARVEINDRMIERLARWLAVRDERYRELDPTIGRNVINERARRAAHEALRYAINNEAS